jgi:hypothetical protein
MKPDAFLWLGDIVYADLSPNGTTIANGIETLHSKYNRQKMHPQYVEHILQNSSIHILGTWDDHDFGTDNSGKSFPHKNYAKGQLLDFLDEREDSPRRFREGVYAAYDFGDHTNDTLTKLIVLDGRYFRDEVNITDPSRALLGEKQWQWLEAQLSNSKARLHFIGTGIQFVEDDWNSIVHSLSRGHSHGESWGLFPEERQRMINLLAKHKVPGVIFLSGDIHFAELAVMECSNVGYPLYDLTSSGMTHAWLSVIESVIAKGRNAMHDHNQSNTLASLISDLISKIAFWIIPRRYSISTYARNNFGFVDIDWTKEVVSLQIYSSSGMRIINKEVRIRDLTYSFNYLSQECSEESRQWANLRSYELSDRGWWLRLSSVALICAACVFLPIHMFLVALINQNRKV